MIDRPAIERLARQLESDATPADVWELKGGISAITTAFELRRRDGVARRIVVRRHAPGHDDRYDLDAAGEFRLLRTLHDAGILVPRPLLYDRGNAESESGAIVMEFVDGSTDIEQRDVPHLIGEYAAQLAMIHRLDWRGLGLHFLPDRAATWARRLCPRPRQLDDSLDEGAIRDVVEAAWPLAPRNAPVLLHGDFWPGNVLWRHDTLAAIIDWEDAAIGDPLSDVAITRLELLWRFDFDAADGFAEQYRSLRDVDMTDLPYWDLLAALRPAGEIGGWASTPAAEDHMRARHHAFTERAMVALAERA